jgi:hypothetical protein
VDTALPGWFFRADIDELPRPLLIATNGYDATLYEMYVAQALPALQRGWNRPVFDGPGQGRALFEQGLVIRPDWENVVPAVVDVAVQRPDVDPDRIALTGWESRPELSGDASKRETKIDLDYLGARSPKR